MVLVLEIEILYNYLNSPYIQQDPKSPSVVTYGSTSLSIPNMMKTEVENCTGIFEPPKQIFEFLVDKLEQDTLYQVLVRARNNHGWGETSHPITFKTSHAVGKNQIIILVMFHQRFVYRNSSTRESDTTTQPGTNHHQTE